MIQPAGPGGPLRLAAGRRSGAAALLLATAISWPFAAVAGCAGSEPQASAGTVTHVIDGDSAMIQVVGELLEVRLDGVDAPEHDAVFGGQAREFLKRHAEGRDVVVSIKDYDRYGRPVARVLLDGQDLSLLLVAEGMAWHYVHYSDDRALARAEQKARAAKRGLWSQADPLPPWKWRERRRQAETRPAPPTTSPGLDDAAYRGNRNSRVFHAPHCPHFRCKSCTVPFATRREALAAGFRPAGDCRP